MALLDWMSDAAGPVVRGDGVRLRPPRGADYVAWSELRARSRDYLQPWEPAWPEDDLTRAAFKRRLAIYARENGQGMVFDMEPPMAGGPEEPGPDDDGPSGGEPPRPSGRPSLKVVK